LRVLAGLPKAVKKCGRKSGQDGEEMPNIEDFSAIKILRRVTIKSETPGDGNA